MYVTHALFLHYSYSLIPTSYFIFSISNKMREVVERNLYLVNSQLDIIDGVGNQMDVVYQCLIAQKIILEQTLQSFDKIES